MRLELPPSAFCHPKSGGLLSRHAPHANAGDQDAVVAFVHRAAHKLPIRMTLARRHGRKHDLPILAGGLVQAGVRHKKALPNLQRLKRIARLTTLTGGCNTLHGHRNVVADSKIAHDLSSLIDSQTLLAADYI